MTADLRAALSTLVAAFERHLEVAAMRHDPDDPGVVAAAQDLADAFDDYDELLFDTTEVATPLAVYDGEDDDEDDDEDDEDDDEDDEDEDEGGVEDAASDGDDELDELDEEGASDHYFGLDDEEYDVEDEDSSAAEVAKPEPN